MSPRPSVWSAMIGYRALYVDFEKGGNTPYEYDMLTHGPIMGVIARFWSRCHRELSSQFYQTLFVQVLRRYT
jgi:hypothetical protein